MLDTGRIIEDRTMRDRLGVFEDRTDAGRHLAAALSPLEMSAAQSGSPSSAGRSARITRTNSRARSSYF